MDTISLKSGIHGAVTSAIPLAGSFDVRALGHCQVSAAGRSNVDKSKVVATPQKTSPSPSSLSFSFSYPLKSLWFGSNSGGDNGHGGVSMGDTPLSEIREKIDTSNLRTEGEIETPAVSEDRDGNWVLRFLQLQPGNKEEDVKGMDGQLLEKGLTSDLDREFSSAGTVKEEDNEEEELCDACRVHFNGEDEVEIDRDTFLRFLHRVSLDQAKLYAKMAYLGNLAYGISDIKPEKLLKSRGLRLVTSSVEKRKLATKSVEELFFSESELIEDAGEDPKKEGDRYKSNSSIAYQVAASAASYLHSHMKDILSTRPPDEEETQESVDGGNDNTTNSNMASFMTATDSVTAVVAAEEEVKQALADDLNSTYSSPCEWFVCDDDESSTRFFVIQGSESLASWQANLLFEPIEFEGFDILAHRGIYEAAKGIYKQILPEVQSHLNTHGNQATFRFTGHSLGGSLSLLINLMLLIRGEVPLSSLLPVITFGAPSIMCGGDRLLRNLGLSRSHVQTVTMHRDIVPRAFSCIYPNHVAQLLKAMNGSFRDHPCLKKEKILYAPMGELLILQPDEKFSPQHHLLPSGSGLYLLSCRISDIADEQKKQFQAAEKLFFNSPHPLEILSDRSAYGSGGAIQRDHDISSYLRCVQTVVRQKLHRIRKAKREQRSQLWWPFIFLSDRNDGIVLDRTLLQRQFNLSWILENSQESLGRFSRHLASQRMDLFMVLLFPARLLLLGTGSTISIH